MDKQLKLVLTVLRHLLKSVDGEDFTEEFEALRRATPIIKEEFGGRLVTQVPMGTMTDQFLIKIEIIHNPTGTGITNELLRFPREK